MGTLPLDRFEKGAVSFDINKFLEDENVQNKVISVFDANSKDSKFTESMILRQNGRFYLALIDTMEIGRASCRERV